MFKTTCLVKARVTAGFDRDSFPFCSSSTSSDDDTCDERVDCKRGEPVLVLYPEGWSSSLSSERMSSDSAAFSERDDLASAQR